VQLRLYVSRAATVRKWASSCVGTDITHQGLNPGAASTFWISSLLSFVKVYSRTSFLLRDGFHALGGRPPVLGAMVEVGIYIGWKVEASEGLSKRESL
jgi:hypothetical protein